MHSHLLSAQPSAGCPGGIYPTWKTQAENGLSPPNPEIQGGGGTCPANKWNTQVSNPSQFLICKMETNFRHTWSCTDLEKMPVAVIGALHLPRLIREAGGQRGQARPELS